MGRLIDADVLIAELKESALHHCNNPREDCLLQRDRVIVRAQPTVEAIPKADYETRLKADMVAMLTDIQMEIADNVESIIGHYDASTPERKRPLCKSARNEGRTECIDVIQQKINALKGDQAAG